MLGFIDVRQTIRLELTFRTQEMSQSKASPDFHDSHRCLKTGTSSLFISCLICSCFSVSGHKISAHFSTKFIRVSNFYSYLLVLCLLGRFKCSMSPLLLLLGN